MASAPPCKASEIRKAVLAIGAGGLIAGTLDLRAAIPRSERVIANWELDTP
jgi:hypothetical protein